MTISNCVAPSRSATARTRATASSKSASAPSTRIRSLQHATWGEMRRADGEPLGEQQLLDRDRRGRLAVRADDVDRGIRVLRVAELGEERAHAVEPEAVARPRAERVEPLDGGHAASVAPSLALSGS